MKPLKILTNRLLTLSTALVAAVTASTAIAADTSYKADVQPIFDNYCNACHKAGGIGTQASGLRLDSYESVMAGTKHGKIVVPGDPLTSNLRAVLEGRTDASIIAPIHIGGWGCWIGRGRISTWRRVKCLPRWSKVSSVKQRRMISTPMISSP